MEPIPKAEFSIVTRASSSAWIPELIASAGPEITETYIDFFTECGYPAGGRWNNRALSAL